MPTSTRTVRTWDSFLKYQERMSVDWLFRGQRDARWGISSSLERLCDSMNVPLDSRARVEQALLREFQRSVPAQSGNAPSPASPLEWIALMQHYGAPTRMVDFTYSMCVAAYFALEFAGPPQTAASSVWCINRNWLLNTSVAALQAAGRSDADRLKSFLGPEDEKLCYQLHFEGSPVDCITNLNPFRLNERLRIQKGLFLVPGSTSKPFAAILESLPGSDSPDNVLRLKLVPSLRERALESLYYMNIGRTTLFPGFEGYAKSLAVFHPVHKRILWS